MAFDRPETEMRHMAAFREHYPTHCELGEQLLRLVDEGDRLGRQAAAVW